MKLIMQVRSSILKRHIHQKAKDAQRERAGKKFRDVHRIGMVMDGLDADCIEFAKRYRDEQQIAGRTVELMAYAPKRARNISYMLPFFTNNEVNWYLKPTGGDTRRFMEEDFDLLVNLCPEQIMPLEYICAFSSANYIMGNGTDHLNSHYDCLIKVNDPSDFSGFMENVHHYLNLQG